MNGFKRRRKQFMCKGKLTAFDLEDAVRRLSLFVKRRTPETLYKVEKALERWPSTPLNLNAVLFHEQVDNGDVGWIMRHVLHTTPKDLVYFMKQVPMLERLSFPTDETVEIIKFLIKNTIFIVIRKSF